MRDKRKQNSDESNVRKMLIRQCVIAARIGDDDQRRDALAFKEIIESADLRKSEVTA